MIVLASLAALVGAASVGAVALDRRRQRQKQAGATAPATESAPGTTATFTSRVTDSVSASVRGPKAWFQSLRRKKPANLPQQFLAWIDKVDTVEQPVKDWLHALSEPGLEAFTEHLAAFCSDMGFELEWLVEQQFDQNPELAQATEKIVLPYCRACQQAAAAQEDIEAHKTLQAFEQNPSSRKQQEFGQKLFAKLVQDGLAAANLSDYLAAAPKRRQQQTLQAIQEAVKKDSPAFNRALKEVIRGLDAASTAAPQTSTTPASEVKAQEPVAAESSAYGSPTYGAPA